MNNTLLTYTQFVNENEQTTKFDKYQSLTNHDAVKSVQFLKDAGLLNELGHITEKIHGSNFSWLYNHKTKTLRVASRERILDTDGSGLFNSRSVFEKLKNEVLELGNFLNKDFQLYGELYGKGVQSEIDYGTDQTFIAFDLKYSNDVYETQTKLEELCNKFKIPVVKSLGICTFEELLEKNVETHSLVAKSNGIESTLEGFVWKPVDTKWYQKTPEEKIRVVIKYKSNNFKEKKATHETKVKKISTSTLGDFESVIDMYINNTRIDAVVSKIGEVSIKDFGKVLPLFTADVLEDLEKDEEVLDMVETKKYINQKCIALLRPYLQKIS